MSAQCAELAALRAQHPLLPSLPTATDPDATMRTAMDMDADGKRWRALADYLINHMAKLQQLLAARLWIESDNAYNALLHGSALWGKVL